VLAKVSTTNGRSAIRNFQVRTDATVSCRPVRRVTRISGAVVLELHPAAHYSGCDPRNVQSLGIALERQRGVHAIGSDVRVDFDAWPGVLAMGSAFRRMLGMTPGEYRRVHRFVEPGPNAT
jgi:hypothetical protein